MFLFSYSGSQRSSWHNIGTYKYTKIDCWNEEMLQEEQNSVHAFKK